MTIDFKYFLIIKGSLIYKIFKIKVNKTFHCVYLGSLNYTRECADEEADKANRKIVELNHLVRDLEQERRQLEVRVFLAVWLYIFCISVCLSDCLSDCTSVCPYARLLILLSGRFAYIVIW